MRSLFHIDMMILSMAFVSASDIWVRNCYHSASSFAESNLLSNFIAIMRHPYRFHFILFGISLKKQTLLARIIHDIILTLFLNNFINDISEADMFFT